MFVILMQFVRAWSILCSLYSCSLLELDQSCVCYTYAVLLELDQSCVCYTHAVCESLINLVFVILMQFVRAWSILCLLYVCSLWELDQSCVCYTYAVLLELDQSCVCYTHAVCESLINLVFVILMQFFIKIKQTIDIWSILNLFLLYSLDNRVL